MTGRSVYWIADCSTVYGNAGTLKPALLVKLTALILGIWQAFTSMVVPSSAGCKQGNEILSEPHQVARQYS